MKTIPNTIIEEPTLIGRKRSPLFSGNKMYRIDISVEIGGTLENIEETSIKEARSKETRRCYVGT
jgi:hypothetical protein